MLTRKENIKLLFGFLIVVGIFVFIGVSSYVEKMDDYDSMLNYEEKFSDSIPQNYLDEVINPASINANDVKVDKSEKIVGFSLSDDAECSFARVKNVLVDKGWKNVESGSSTSSSFYKDEGNYSWLFLNCISVGGETSVVLTVD